MRRGERPSRQSTCVALRGALRGAGARVEEGCQTPDVNAALCGSVSGEEARPFSLAGRTSPFPSPGDANDHGKSQHLRQAPPALVPHGDTSLAMGASVRSKLTPYFAVQLSQLGIIDWTDFETVL